ncbi:MAG: hypothetical protein AB1758_27595 [Candidatus Eremiobacterota bacterium]
MSQAFLDQLEHTRQTLESRLLRLPEASDLLARYQGRVQPDAQTYLHALPTTLALVSSLAHAPRSAGHFRDLLERTGPIRLRQQEVGNALMCFGVAYLYRAVARATGDANFAQLLARVAARTALDPALQPKVDWVVKSLSHRHPDGSRDRFAPPTLLVSWLTGSESYPRAYEALGFLEKFQAFVEKALEHALRYQIFMEFPW